MKEARSKYLSAKIKGLRLVINGESYTAQQLGERSPEPQEIPMREGSKNDPSTPILTRDLHLGDEKVGNISSSPLAGQSGYKPKEDKNQKRTVYNTRPRVNSNALSQRKNYDSIHLPFTPLGTATKKRLENNK
ncbi:hypothetical protein JTB14_014060 [Gonioctena quinquepunctata]|nr:hypothetical protein JTB14_014060 [Gonioctena quinquepunctata]